MIYGMNSWEPKECVSRPGGWVRFGFRYEKVNGGEEILVLLLLYTTLHSRFLFVVFKSMKVHF